MTTTLYRPVGPEELKLIEGSGCSDVQPRCNPFRVGLERGPTRGRHSFVAPTPGYGTERRCRSLKAGLRVGDADLIGYIRGRAASTHRSERFLFVVLSYVVRRALPLY